MKINEFKKLKKIKLSDFEKKDLFNRISNTIIMEGEEKVDLHYPTPSPFFRFSFLLENRRLQVAMLSIFTMFLISATAFASLDTLPGDLLYDVKINVVEKISSLLFITPESQAGNNLSKIEKRMDEFKKLAEEGKLTEENTNKIEKNIDKNLKDFDQNIKQIKEKTKEMKENNKLEKELEFNLQKHTEEIEKIREDEKVSNKRVLQSVINRAHSSREEL